MRGSRVLMSTLLLLVVIADQPAVCKKTKKHHSSKVGKIILNTTLTILEEYLQHVLEEVKDGLYHVIDAPLDNLAPIQELAGDIKAKKKPFKKYGAGIKDEVLFGLHEVAASALDNLPALKYTDRVDPKTHPRWVMHSPPTVG